MTDPAPVPQAPRFQQWCLASHGHHLHPDDTGNWVRYVTFLGVDPETEWFEILTRLAASPARKEIQ